MSPNGGYRFLDVADPAAMKARLDDVTLSNFRAAAEVALARSGATLADVSYLCGIHMKRSAHDGLVATLGLDPSRAAYLDDTGHMSGVDPCSRSTAPRAPARWGRATSCSCSPPARATRGRLGRPLGRGVKVDDVQPGLELGPSEWREVTQERIDAFAAATDDPQWIHVDPERAAAGPFGTTIAHGYLTLALLVPFAYELLPVEDAALTVNYGLNRVRFPSPVPSGSRVRARFRVEGVEEVTGGTQVTLAATVEREGAEKPVCVAELVFRFLTDSGGTR